MSCSPFDLRDYFLEELAGPEQRQVEAHVKTCAACREELDRLRITGAALCSMADEEIPQRIAFVSDKIFEPSPWRRWLAAFWNSGARLGFVSAAMLSASLVLFALKPAPAPVIGVMRPAVPAVMTVSQASAVPEAVVLETAVSEADVHRRIQAAVDEAVELKTKDLIKEIQSERVRLTLATDQLEQDEQRMKRMQVIAANYGLPERFREEVK
jgi:anti-sigma factor RsiW